jgi:streptogramin lyase
MRPVPGESPRPAVGCHEAEGALEWDGEHLWTSQLTSSGDIVRFDVLGNVIDTMASPAAATAGLAYDAEGGFMWMSDYAEDEETVLIRRVRIQSDP